MKNRIVLHISVLFSLLSATCYLGAAPLQANSSEGWVTAGANVERTSWVPDEAPGRLKEIWVKPVQPYISQKVQIIAAAGKLFLSTARGLYAFNAETGAELWVYSTELPLGHSPTHANGRVYVGGLDRKLHAIDANTGKGLWTFTATGGFHTCPLVVDGVIYAGSRDGRMYAVTSRATSAMWNWQKWPANPATHNRLN